MNSITIKEGWNDTAHLRLLQTAADSLVEMNVIPESVAKEISNAIDNAES